MTTRNPRGPRSRDAGNGAEDWLGEFYSKHRQQLFTFALSITCCPHLAEDAIHEAFYKLYRTNTKPKNPKAYVFAAVRNAAIDQRARTPPTEELGEYIFDSSEGPRGNLEADESRRRVIKILSELSDDERQTIVQHIYAEMTFREIAELQNVPLSTVTSWYRRGMQKLQKWLEDES